VIAIAAEGGHSLALKSDGTVVAWGCGGTANHGQCSVPAGLHGVTAIDAGGLFSLAVNDPFPPTANPTQSPAATANGWNGSDVTVFWGWSDPGRGIDFSHCTTRSTSSGEGVQTLTATCQDQAGNVGTASYTVKVDKTGPAANPTQSPAANAAGWNNTNVTVNWNWTDVGSGIVPASCPTSSTSSGQGVQTLTATCADQAGNATSASYTVKLDRVSPRILANVSPPINGFGWNNSAVTVSFTCQDQAPSSGMATNTVGGNTTLSNEGTNFSVTNTGTCVDNAGNVATPVTVSPINIDLTKPTISAAATTQPNANGWYNSDVTVHFTCADALSGIDLCPSDQVLNSEGTGVSSTVQTVRDKALTVSDPSNVVTINLDKTAPVVAVTGVTDGAHYPFGSVPAAGCSTNDALSGAATQATLSVTGGNGDGTGTFTATCSGATDQAGNGAAPVNVSYTVDPPPTAPPTNTPAPPTVSPTNTAVPPTATPTNTPANTPTNTPVPPTAPPTKTPVASTATPTGTPVADACGAMPLLDNFNRANGGLGSQWAGLTDQNFYKIASNRVDVQLGGAVVWKPTVFGPNQAAFVTLSTVDAKSPSQGVLLKVQTGTLPNAGAIAVVYDSGAKAVRVSTLRLNNPTWTPYGNTPVTFANGDKLGGCVKADGTVRVYKNNSLLNTITLNAADQQFFNAKGGKLGLWTIAASNAFFDDFGGGALDGVSAADAADEPSNPEANAQTNLIFLPVVSR